MPLHPEKETHGLDTPTQNGASSSELPPLTGLHADPVEGKV